MRLNINVLRSLINEALDNAYTVLGVQPGASDKEIRQAWRAKALQYRNDRQAGDPFAHAKIAHVTRAKDHLTGPGRGGDGMFAGYEGDAVVPPAGVRSDASMDDELHILSGGAVEDSIERAKTARKPKDSYKVYPTKDKRRVLRIGGKLYGTGPDGALGDGGTSQFRGGDRAKVAPGDDGRMTVNKPDSDHSQTWDPIEQNDGMEEARRTVNRAVIGSLARCARR